MKANELRIGNWLKINGRTQQVVDCMCDSVNTKFHQGIPFDMIEPIPLSKNILKRLGFYSSGNNFWYRGYDYSVNHTPDKSIFHSDFTSPKYGFEVHYVHQLQNIYFVLFNEELQMK